MQKYVVTSKQEVEADSAEQAALLVYQSLVKGPVPVSFVVEDEAKTTVDILLDRSQADEFAEIDHTADPGNW
jgi:hypothetical protein